MLVAFLEKNGQVTVRDTDETPAAYLLTIEERTLVAREHENVLRKGNNRSVHVSLNPLSRPDVRGIGQEAAMRALFDHLNAHPKFMRYVGQVPSIEAANAETMAVDAGEVKDASAQAIVTTR